MNVQQTLLLPHSINTLALMHLGNWLIESHNVEFVRTYQYCLQFY